MIVVYVAGPYANPTSWGRDQNITRAREIGAEIARMGASPMIPHSNCAHMDGIVPNEFWYEATMALMVRCDAVMMIRGWVTSVGARAEKLEAERIGIPVFEDLDALAAWLDEREEVIS